jgi:ribosomal protein L11 methyltransferase
MEAGALGTETIEDANGTARVVGYFESLIELDAISAKLREALGFYGLSHATLREVTARELPDRTGSLNGRSTGSRLKLAACHCAALVGTVCGSAASDRILIRIDPGMAFGTGTHETTRLCLKAIDKYFSGGSFLDVGTGTGILAIAAAKIAPGRSRHGV